jgi:hypothetical protein
MIIALESSLMLFPGHYQQIPTMFPQETWFECFLTIDLYTVLYKASFIQQETF